MLSARKHLLGCRYRKVLSLFLALMIATFAAIGYFLVLLICIFRGPKLLLKNLAIELSSTPSAQTVMPTGFVSSTSPSIPLVARVYLKLGAWQWALSPGLDDDSIQGNESLCTPSYSCRYPLKICFISYIHEL